MVACLDPLAQHVSEAARVVEGIEWGVVVHAELVTSGASGLGAPQEVDHGPFHVVREWQLEGHGRLVLGWRDSSRLPVEVRYPDDKLIDNAFVSRFHTGISSWTLY